MALTRFKLDIDPRPKGRPKFRRIGNGVSTYTPAETVRYENEIRRAVSNWGPLIEEPVKVRMMFSFVPPKSWSNKKRQQAISGEIAHTKKPDLDNLVKAVLDGMIPSKKDPDGGILKDDNLITTLSVGKQYSETPGIIIELETLEDKLLAP